MPEINLLASLVLADTPCGLSFAPCGHHSYTVTGWGSVSGVYDVSGVQWSGELCSDYPADDSWFLWSPCSPSLCSDMCFLLLQNHSESPLPLPVFPDSGAAFVSQRAGNILNLDVFDRDCVGRARADAIKSIKVMKRGPSAKALVLHFSSPPVTQTAAAFRVGPLHASLFKTEVEDKV